MIYSRAYPDTKVLVFRLISIDNIRVFTGTISWKISLEGIVNLAVLFGHIVVECSPIKRTLGLSRFDTPSVLDNQVLNAVRFRCNLQTTTVTRLRRYLHPSIRWCKHNPV